MKYLIFIFWNGELGFIRRARTERGAAASVRNAMTYHRASNVVKTKVIRIEEILNWEERGIAELENLMKL